jgi:DNA-binding XRE family transcriptional regulator
MKTHKQFSKELLRDSKLREIDAVLDPEFKVYGAIVEARIRNNLTQKQLADKVGIAQSALARIESGKISSTITTIQKILASVGLKLKVVKA